VQVTRTVNVSAAPVTDVFFVVNPEISNVTDGDTFSVTIQVQANDQPVDGSEVHLTFDSAIVEVSSLTPGGTLTLPLISETSDNTLGTIDYSVGSLSGPVSGTFDLLTIEFSAVGAGSTQLNFIDPDGAASTIATFGGNNVLTGTTNGLVNVDENPGLTITPDPILTNLLSNQTTTVDYVVDANDTTALPSSASMALIDDATSNPATWATTVSSADQGITYQVNFDATGLAPGTYTGTLTASGVAGYDDATAVVSLTVDPPPSLVITPNPINATVETEQSTTGSFTVGTSDESSLPGDLLLSAVDDATILTPTWLSFNPGNDGFEVDATDLPPGTYSATVTGTGTGYNDGTTVINLFVTAPEVTCARVAFDTGGGLAGSSTFGGGLFINNNSTSSVNIVSVSIDLSTAVFPNMLFDPIGTAGDATASCVEIIGQTGGDGSVGLTIPGNAGSGNDPDCVDPFSGEIVPGGYTVMTLDFTDFEPGEELNIEVDVDPLSIIGFNSAGNAGAVSGSELIGSTITVTYSDGTSATRQLYQVGASLVNSENFFNPETPQCVAPSLSVGGIAGNGIVSETDQIATITGPANAAVEVLVYGTTLEDLVIDPTTLDPFEMNKTQSLQALTTTLNGAGTNEVALDLTGTSDSMTYYIVATIIPATDGCGQGACDISNVVRIKLDENLEGTIWLEDFEDLSNGDVVDNGATAWSSARTGGTFEVLDGRFWTNVSGGVGTWTSEVIPIGGTVSLSMDVDDSDDNKESSDFVRALYILDGGTPVEFGFVNNDIDPQTFI
ncbi:cohesin domain-containing protein, partial [Croceitalea rosinachiae]